jgi:hypothetical protein
VTTQKTMVQTQTVMSLTAADYVEVYGYLEAYDGYVESTGSLFYAARIA